jgi:hypothetical protein
MQHAVDSSATFRVIVGFFMHGPGFRIGFLSRSQIFQSVTGYEFPERDLMSFPQPSPGSSDQNAL